MAEQPTQGKLDFSIVSAQLTIEALRDSGYKDTDHALAELIDNSVEARADLIEVAAVEVPGDPNRARSRPSIAQIAVADDGEGMDSTTLRRALKFGDGTRLDRQLRGIGRFGIGLPQSSMSQCKRVDVWTWRNGPDNASHCHLDLAEIRAGQREVPAPVDDPVPDYWRILDCTHEQTGTLVVWSQLDRVRWRGGKKTLERTATLCGRIYRKFLVDEQSPISIRLLRVANDGGEPRLEEDELCQPNDPLYLMEDTSTPKPFSDRPMFRPFNDRKWTIQVGSSSGDVHVRCSLARPDAISQEQSAVAWPRSYNNPGDSPWGKHASRNKGVSIVRAKRELEVSLAWVNNYEPEERWWSIEVEFDPILDEIFGVVNTKQHAHNFVNGAGFDPEDSRDEGETYGTFMERLEQEGDPRFHLVEIWQWIGDQVTQMRKERRKIVKGARERHSHPESQKDIEDVATDIVKAQTARGQLGASDQAPQIDDGEKREQLEMSLKSHQVDAQTARARAIETVDKGRRVQIQAGRVDSSAFFGVESVGNIIQVWLNDRHPAYEHLIEVLMADEESSAEDLERRLQKADFTLQMLLVAWARYEDKLGKAERERAQDMRTDWGREARLFLGVIES